MITRNKAEEITLEWFSTYIGYHTLSNLIERCEHLILTSNLYSENDSKKIMSDIPGLLEFLKTEKGILDAKPTKQRMQRLLNYHFPYGEKPYKVARKDDRMLQVMYCSKQFRVNLYGKPLCLFIVKESFDQDIELYRDLHPVYSVWAWKPEERPVKLYLDKIFSKQYVFPTLSDARKALNQMKNERMIETINL